jgi:hypothetical protein
MVSHLWVSPVLFIYDIIHSANCHFYCLTKRIHKPVQNIIGMSEWTGFLKSRYIWLLKMHSVTSLKSVKFTMWQVVAKIVQHTGNGVFMRWTRYEVSNDLSHSENKRFETCHRMHLVFNDECTICFYIKKISHNLKKRYPTTKPNNNGKYLYNRICQFMSLISLISFQ